MIQERPRSGGAGWSHIRLKDKPREAGAGAWCSRGAADTGVTVLHPQLHPQLHLLLHPQLHPQLHPPFPASRCRFGARVRLSSRAPHPSQVWSLGSAGPGGPPRPSQCLLMLPQEQPPGSPRLSAAPSLQLESCCQDMDLVLITVSANIVNLLLLERVFENVQLWP